MDCGVLMLIVVITLPGLGIWRQRPPRIRGGGMGKLSQDSLKPLKSLIDLQCRRESIIIVFICNAYSNP